MDRYTVFVGGLIIGGADAPTPCDGDGWVAEGGMKLTLKDCEVLGNGALLTFEPARRVRPETTQRPFLREPSLLTLPPSTILRMALYVSASMRQPLRGRASLITHLHTDAQ